MYAAPQMSQAYMGSAVVQLLLPAAGLVAVGRVPSAWVQPPPRSSAACSGGPPARQPPPKSSRHLRASVASTDSASSPPPPRLEDCATPLGVPFWLLLRRVPPPLQVMTFPPSEDAVLVAQVALQQGDGLEGLATEASS